jgi:hypothetical protein
VKGKMSYLAPEIVAGGRPIPASDQFATGSVLWEALVGRKLFDGATDYEVYCRLRDCMVQPLRPLRSDVPAPFAQIIGRALSPGVDQRFPSTREMARQIGTALKKVQLRKDLHTVLAKSVSDIRGQRSGPITVTDTSEATPIAEILAEETPRIEVLPTPDEKKQEKPRGLRHYLPFFGRKRG